MFDPSNVAQDQFVGYGSSRLPDERDSVVGEFINELIQSAGTSCDQNPSSISENARRVLRAYAERMASLAVRRRDPNLLLRATVALVLGGLSLGTRESFMSAVTIHDAAQRLNAEVGDIFKQASEIVGEPGRARLKEWLNRRPGDRSLASMGFVAVEDPDGFRYVFHG